MLSSAITLPLAAIGKKILNRLWDVLYRRSKIREENRNEENTLTIIRNEHTA